MGRRWAVSFGEKERMNLERIMMDEDPDAALEFMRNVIYPTIKEAEKPRSCFHDAEKPVTELSRPVGKHRNLGTFD